MNVQDERIQSACQSLSLNAIAEHYPALAHEAAESDVSYTDFLERCLKAERHASFPARCFIIRTVEVSMRVQSIASYLPTTVSSAR